MRGLVFDVTSPESSQLREDLPEPQFDPSQTQVLLEVLACGINHADWKTSFGAVPAAARRVTGIDLCGQVIATPEVEQPWKIGDQVLVDPILSCAECADCRSGRERDCQSFAFLGLTRDGGHAERVCVPASALHRIPRGISPQQAASIPLAYSTAWRLLQSKTRLSGSETVLVVGASGALGIAAVQVARLAGCRTLALTSTDWKAAELKALGAHRAFVRDPEGQWQSEVLKATGQRGAEIIVDSIGPTLWPTLLPLLARGGQLLSCGNLSGGEVMIDLDLLQSRDLTIRGAAFGGRAELSRALALFSLGKIQAVVDRDLPLSRAKEAYEVLRSRGVFGKIVLHP